MTDSLCRKRKLADSFIPCDDQVVKVIKPRSMTSFKKVMLLNAFMPSVPFKGHKPTVQTQIRRRAASDQDLHCF